jgi:hypothetical protein
MIKTDCIATFLSIFLLTPAFADTCYHKFNDKAETITELDDGSLIWRLKKKRVEFETGGAGTGLSYRIALNRKNPNQVLRYEYKGNNLLFGSVKYVPGC